MKKIAYLIVALMFIFFFPLSNWQAKSMMTTNDVYKVFYKNIHLNDDILMTKKWLSSLEGNDLGYSLTKWSWKSEKNMITLLIRNVNRKEYTTFAEMLFEEFIFSPVHNIRITIYASKNNRIQDIKEEKIVSNIP